MEKKEGVVRILALDQATRNSGWSVFDDLELIDHGVFSTNLTNEIQRDHTIKEWLISMIKKYQPDYVGIEDLHYKEGGNTVLMSIDVFRMLARLQGILMDACYECGVPCDVIHTSVWRATNKVTGRTRDDKKRSMQKIILQQYGLQVSDDEADAIGIGKHMAIIKKRDN